MCRICNYNQVQHIDRALLAGATPVSLSQQYNFSPLELRHHQEHLQRKMALAQQRFQVNLYQGMFCKLNNVMEMVLWVVRMAKRGEDFKLFVQASREFSRVLQLMHKMAPQLQFDPEFLYCLMASPEWDLQEDALLPNAFQSLSKTRQTLKVNLFSPCPETAPESAPDHQLTPFLLKKSALPSRPASQCPDPLYEETSGLDHHAPHQRQASAT